MRVAVVGQPLREQSPLPLPREEPNAHRPPRKHIALRVLEHDQIPVVVGRRANH
jgi:hypothetical protein